MENDDRGKAVNERGAPGGVDLEKLLEERARLEELIHRKFTQTITVMFTDFKGSTAIAESEGDVASRLLIKKHHDILFPIIKENDGVLVKTMGDGTLSWFHKAQDSVRTAAAFQKALKEFNAGRPAGKTPVIVRIGINTGTGIVEETDIFGDVVNVAARYEGLAAPGEICVSETTFESLDNRDEFRCRFHKTTELKGKSGLHKVYKVFWDDAEAMDSPGGGNGPGGAAQARPGVAPMFRLPFMSRPVVDQKRRVNTERIREEAEASSRAAREIRGLVVRSGDTQKLAGETLKVMDDIVIETGALLSIENAQLFFAEDAGIVSSGTFRAKGSLFTAADAGKGWRNVSLFPQDGRANFVEKCTFRFGRGRSAEYLPRAFRAGAPGFADNCRVGGGLLVMQVTDKTFSLTGCTFHRCSAHEGGGAVLLNAQIVAAACIFEYCTAGISGGGMLCRGAAPTVRGCSFTGCTADKGGGGMACEHAHATIDNCLFEKCSTRHLYGGGLHCASSNPIVTGSKFIRCAAGKSGGGIYCDEASGARVVASILNDCIPNGSSCGATVPSVKKGIW